LIRCVDGSPIEIRARAERKESDAKPENISRFYLGSKQDVGDLTPSPDGKIVVAILNERNGRSEGGLCPTMGQ